VCLHKCVSQRQREKQQSVWLPKITEKNRRRRRLLGFTYKTRRAFGGAHVPPTKVFRRLTASVNETILKPRLAAATNTYTSDFQDIIFRMAIRYNYTIAEKAILFRHPDYNPDRAQKLISSSMSRNLSTRNISSKSMHAFLSNLANRHPDR